MVQERQRNNENTWDILLGWDEDYATDAFRQSSMVDCWKVQQWQMTADNHQWWIVGKYDRDRLLPTVVKGGLLESTAVVGRPFCCCCHQVWAGSWCCPLELCGRCYDVILWTEKMGGTSQSQSQLLPHSTVMVAMTCCNDQMYPPKHYLQWKNNDTSSKHNNKRNLPSVWTELNDGSFSKK
jgi:hypothetical protein